MTSIRDGCGHLLIRVLSLLKMCCLIKPDVAMWEWSDWGNTLICCWLVDHMSSASKHTLDISFFVTLWLTKLHKAHFIFYPGWCEINSWGQRLIRKVFTELPAERSFPIHLHMTTSLFTTTITALFRDLSIKGSNFPVSGCGHFVGQRWWFITKMTDQVNYHRLTNDRNYLSTDLKSVSEASVCVVYTLTVSHFLEQSDTDAAEIFVTLRYTVAFHCAGEMQIFVSDEGVMPFSPSAAQK